jgi:hypothetical protein
MIEEHKDECKVKLLHENAFEVSQLKWLLSRLNSPLYSIVKVGDEYWLKSSRFEKLTDSAAVSEEAKKLIIIIKGIAKSKSEPDDYQSINIGDTVTGKGVHHLTAEAGGERIILWTKNGRCYMKNGDKDGYLISEVPDFSYWESLGIDMSSIVKDYTSGQGTSLHKERQYESYINGFIDWIEDNYIFETFSYFADESSWTSLWKTYEQIKYDIDCNLDDEVSPEKTKLTRYHWVEEDKLKKFKKSSKSSRC